MSQKEPTWLLESATVNGPGSKIGQVFNGKLNVKAWGLEPDGADLVTNGAMAADSDWTKGTGYTIADGVASAAQGSASDLSQAIAFVDGSIYEIAFDVLNYGGTGNVRAVVGDIEGAPRAADGTFTQYITAGPGADLDIRKSADFVGDIDNVTAKLLNSTWDGATVHVQIETDTPDKWFDLYTFTEDGAQFGEVGSEHERFRAVITGKGSSTNLNCTITP